MYLFGGGGCIHVVWWAWWVASAPVGTAEDDGVFYLNGVLGVGVLFQSINALL